MTTYQGVAWLDVQLATIFAQTYQDWQLIVRDDGSTDGTRDIIRFWRDRFPDRMVFLDEQIPEHLGAAGSFSALMKASSSDYVIGADQDDVWYGDKVSKAVSAMQSVEDRCGADRPILIYTDLRMVDGNLHEMKRSVLKFRGMKSFRSPTIGNLCLENSAHGCTMIINRALIQKSYPIPQPGVHGDWWFALVAVAFGTIQALPDTSMDYRRHNANISEMSSISKTIIGLLNPMSLRNGFYDKLEVNKYVIKTFLDYYGDHLSQRDRSALGAFINLQNLSFWGRRKAVLRYRLWFSSWIRTLGLILLV